MAESEILHYFFGIGREESYNKLNRFYKAFYKKEIAKQKCENLFTEKVSAIMDRMVFNSYDAFFVSISLHQNNFYWMIGLPVSELLRFTFYFRDSDELDMKIESMQRKIKSMPHSLEESVYQIVNEKNKNSDNFDYPECI